MKRKNLLVLVIVAIVLVGLAALTKRRRPAAPPPEIGRPVLENLAVNEVEKIVVTSVGDTAVVARAEDRWVVPGRYDYPARFSKIKEALLGLRDMKVGQVMRVDDEQRRRMKMLSPRSAPDDASQAGTLVQLYGGEGREMASILLGEARRRQPEGQGPDMFGGGYPDGQFVSTDLGATVYLVPEQVHDFAAGSEDWLEREIVNVPSGDVEEIRIGGPDREAVVLRLDPQSNRMEVQGLAEDEETDTSGLYSVRSALSYLNLENVADPSLSDEAFGMDEPSLYRVTTKKGAIYTVSIGGSPAEGEGRYARFEVSLKAEPDGETGEGDEEATGGDAGGNAGEGTGEKDEEEEDEESRELEENVAQLNGKLRGWTYVISSYKAEAMTKERSALVKKTEAESDDKEEGAEETEAAATPEPMEEAAPDEAPGEVAEPAAAAADAPRREPAPATTTPPAPRPEDK